MRIKGIKCSKCNQEDFFVIRGDLFQCESCKLIHEFDTNGGFLESSHNKSSNKEMKK